MKIKRLGYSMIFLMATFLFVALFSFQKVGAIYNPELNKVRSYNVDRSANTLSIEVEYQYGITDLQIYICDVSSTGSAINEYSGCVNSDYLTNFIDGDLKFTVEEGVATRFLINKSDSPVAYGKTYNTPSNGLAINLYSGKYDELGKLNTQYTIAVKARFCSVRTVDKTGCFAWNSETPLVIFSEQFNLQMGVTSSSEINGTIGEMLGIVNTVVLPILWIVLGLLLIIRGIMLGIDIVKSADEPEVRKKKVSGLIWLFIGIFVAYVITIVASVVMTMFGYGGIF